MQFIWILFDSSFIALLDQVYSFLSIYTLINSYSFTQHQYPITKSMIAEIVQSTFDEIKEYTKIKLDKLTDTKEN